jgi:HEAT repeat protein
VALAVAGAAPEPLSHTHYGAARDCAASPVRLYADFSTVVPAGRAEREELTMDCVIGRAGAAALVAMTIGWISSHLASHPTAEENVAAPAAAVDVATLLAAAHGAPPMICALAARSVLNGGWGRWADAPVTPLGARMRDVRGGDDWREELSTGDQDRLLAALGSDDACVRELSVRMLGDQRSERVADGLVTRLGAGDASLREVAAFGLGLMRPQRAVDVLTSALRDATTAVRANAAWALGRIANGRALAPLVALFQDGDSTVREAAVVAAGQMDSASVTASLVRVLEHDPAPSVRRVAAWALGKLGGREGAAALAAALSHDTDPRVREMSAWALGAMEGESGTAALTSALAHDGDDKVRETAAWALAELEARSAVEALDAAAQQDRSARVRGTAAWAIGQLNGRGGRAPAGLQRVLRDEDHDARLKAAWALGQIGDSSALPAIRDALNVERNDDVRRALVRALVQSGGRSEQALTELLSSDDPAVREAAVRGLAGARSFNPWPWPWPRPRPFP